MSDLANIIAPPVQNVYGRIGNPDQVQHLIDRLAERVGTHTDTDFSHWESREDMIRETCWMTFSGGGTAASVAADVEQALVTAGR